MGGINSPYAARVPIGGSRSTGSAFNVNASPGTPVTSGPFSYGGGRAATASGGGNPSGFLSSQWQNLGPTGQAAAGIAGVAGLMSMFNRPGPDQDMARMTGDNEEALSGALGYGGELGQTGMQLSNGMIDQMKRGQQGMLDSYFNPEQYDRMRAGLMSDVGAATQGAMAGMPPSMMGGGAGQARMLGMLRQNQSGLAPSLANIGGMQLQGRREGFNAMNNFATNRFNMGMGLRNQGFGIANNGRQTSINNLMRLKQMKIQQQQQQQAAQNAALSGIGTLASGGIG
jgi:hypothetical protein